MLSPRIKATWLLADELPSDGERLGEALRLGLDGVGDRDAQAAAVVEEPLVAADVLRRRDQQDVADARQHEHRERIVDHRLVVDGQQLLADGPGDRIEPRARSAGENDSLGEEVCLRHDFFPAGLFVLPRSGFVGYPGLPPRLPWVVQCGSPFNPERVAYSCPRMTTKCPYETPLGFRVPCHADPGSTSRQPGRPTNAFGIRQLDNPNRSR